MIIALDWDRTYTADPYLWQQFINVAITQGHTVVIVTMRYEHEPIKNPHPGLKIIYTGRKAKWDFIKADIWIDDEPGYIVRDHLVQ